MLALTKDALFLIPVGVLSYFRRSLSIGLFKRSALVTLSYCLCITKITILFLLTKFLLSFFLERWGVLHFPHNKGKNTFLLTKYLLTK